MDNSTKRDSVFVQFYTDALHMKAESEKQGRQIWKDVPWVRITVPGDKNNIIERPAKDVDKQRFPREWERYERSEQQGVQGTPIEQWPQITRAQVKEAKYFEVHTVEQMAELADAHCQKMGMGFRELREKAKAYLQSATDTAAASAQAAENQQLKDMIKDMQEQLKALGSKGPGRPKKETAEA